MTVSIIIPSYSEKSRKYLDLCMRSIKNLDYPKESIEIILSTPIGYEPMYDGTTIVHHPDPNRSFAQAVNYGVKHSKNDLILLLSDDTVITKVALKNMVRATGDDDMILAATSNCDNHWRYHLHFFTWKNEEAFEINRRFFNMDELDGLETTLQDAYSIYPTGLIPTNINCFYAVMIPRKTWNKIGDLDEQFKDGYEDSDYCARAVKLGVPLVITLDAVIWHFGGSTTSWLGTPELAAENKRKFEDKWKSINQTAT